MVVEWWWYGGGMNADNLRSLINDDVIHGYSLPLPLSKIHLLPGALLAPMNIVTQDTIDEKGNIIPKFRLIHDQSFKFVKKEELLPCYFGWVMRRLVNWIVAARRKYPGRRIFATKVDFKSAYRGLHLNFRIALQSCTQLPDKDIALLALRLTFGGAVCPYEWNIISETICDLATAIAHDDNWEPSTLQAPDQELVPPPSFLPDNIPFCEGKELIVDVDINERGTHEMYLDDFIGIGIDLPGSDNTTSRVSTPTGNPHVRQTPTSYRTNSTSDHGSKEQARSQGSTGGGEDDIGMALGFTPINNIPTCE